MSILGDEFISTSSDNFGFKSLGSPIQLISDYEEKLPFNHIKNLSNAPQHGWFVAAGKDKIILGSIKDLKQDIANEESAFVTNRHELAFENVINASFTKDEKQLIVITSTDVHYASISDYKTLSSSDFNSINFGPSSIDLATVSPSNSSIIAILTKDGELQILDISTGGKNLISKDVVYFSWSPKGKQIAIATKDGFIKQLTISGEIKLSIDRPEDLKEEGALPVSLEWIAPFRFLVLFGETPSEDDEEPSYDFKAFVLTHDKSTGETSFEENFDLIPAFGSILRKPTIYASSFHNLSETLKLLTIVASSTSVEISALIYSEVLLPETDASRAALPIDENTGNDINAIGLITDINDTGKIEEPCQGVSEAEWLPTIWVLGNDGKIQGWYVYYVHDLKNGTFKQDGVKEYEDALYKTALEGGSTAPAPTTTAVEPAQTNNASPFASFGKPSTETKPFAFGQQQSDNKSPFASFGNNDKKDDKPAFGSSGFGNSSDKPEFGSSGFGSSTDHKPAFGSSAFGSSTDNKPAFGSSGFGSSTDTKPAFGSTGFGQSSFGQSSDNKPAFGSTGFGSGQASIDKPAFGSTGFGQSSDSKPAFGSTGFGSSSFGSSSTDKPAFGSGGFGSSGFGQAANKSAFGSSGFGSSAFGQSSTDSKSPFGAIGQSSTDNKSPFGAIGQSSTDNKSPFGSSAVGQTSTESKSLFGSSSSGQSSAFGQTPVKNPAPFASPASGTAGFGKSPDKPAAKPAFGSPFNTTVPKPVFGGNVSDSPFGKKLSDDESPFAKFGTKETATKSPFNSSQPFDTNETSSLFSKQTKDTAQSSLNEEKKGSEDKSSFNTLSGDLGGSLFGNESSKAKVPGLSDSEGDDDDDSEQGGSGDEDSEQEDNRATDQPTTTQGPTSFGASGPTSFGGSSGPTSFGSKAFGSTGFGSTGFGSTGFKFGQQPQQLLAESKEEKVEKPAFGGFGQFASQNKLQDLSKQKSIFEQTPSAREEKGESTEKEEPEPSVPLESNTEQQSLEEDEEEEEESEDEDEDEDEDEEEEEEEVEVPETTNDEGFTEGVTEELSSQSEEEDEDDDQNNYTEEADETRNFESDVEEEDEETEQLGKDVDEALNFNEEDPEADRLGDDIDKNLNLDEENEAANEAKQGSEENEDHEFENVKEEDGKDSSSLDSYKDKEDEALYEEVKAQKFNSTTETQTEGAPHAHKAVSTEISTNDVGVSASVETSEIEIQTDDIKFESIALQTFEDDEAHFASYFVPSEVPAYERLASVKYPQLSQDPIFSQLEKIYYDTQAEISIIEGNCVNLGKFLDDHLRTDVVNTEASLPHPNYWRLSEAGNIRTIIEKFCGDASKTKQSLESEEGKIKLIQKQLDQLEKQSINVREKILSLSKLSDKAVLNARDLPIDVLVLQDKIRKTHAQVLEDLRTSEQKILTLKTTTNVYYNEPPTPAALQSIINHINSITRGYSQETRQLSEQIANLNINHSKILEKLHDVKNESFKESVWENRGLTKLEVEDLSKKMEIKSQISKILQEKPVKTVTINL